MLKAARDRKKAATGKCGGRRSAGRRGAGQGAACRRHVAAQDIRRACGPRPWRQPVVFPLTSAAPRGGAASVSAWSGARTFASPANIVRRAEVVPLLTQLIEEQRSNPRAASAARGTSCDTPSFSRVASPAHDPCRSMPPRCFLEHPTAPRRSRSGCIPSQVRPRGRQRP